MTRASFLLIALSSLVLPSCKSVSLGGSSQDADAAGAEGGGLCYSPTSHLDIAYQSGSVGCSCDASVDRDVCVQNVALMCIQGRWHAVEDGPCMPMFQKDAAADSAGLCYSPSNPNNLYQSGSVGCSCDSSVDQGVCAQGIGLICIQGRWQAVVDGPCMPMPQEDAAAGLCYSPSNPGIVNQPGAVGCSCNASVDRDVCVQGVALICREGRWQAVEDGPCMPMFQQDAAADSVGLCYSPTNPGNFTQPGAVGCSCNASVDRDVCVQGMALICTQGRWQAVKDGPCMPPFKQDASPVGCDPVLAAQALSAAGLTTVGEAQTANEDLPANLASGANWGVKDIACRDGGYDLSPVAGKTVCLVSFDTTGQCQQLPAKAWVVMSEGVVRCIYQSASLNPGIYSVHDALCSSPDAGTPCQGSNPAGRTCRKTTSECIPSDCTCRSDGNWGCTDDCRSYPLCNADGGT